MRASGGSAAAAGNDRACACRMYGAASNCGGQSAESELYRSNAARCCARSRTAPVRIGHRDRVKIARGNVLIAVTGSGVVHARTHRDENARDGRRLGTAGLSDAVRLVSKCCAKHGLVVDNLRRPKENGELRVEDIIIGKRKSSGTESWSSQVLRPRLAGTGSDSAALFGLAQTSGVFRGGGPGSIWSQQDSRPSSIAEYRRRRRSALDTLRCWRARDVWRAGDARQRRRWGREDERGFETAKRRRKGPFASCTAARRRLRWTGNVLFSTDVPRARFEIDNDTLERCVTTA